MNRIILGMALANYVMVALTAYLGLLSHPTENVQTLGDDPFRYHFPLGIFTPLFTMLTHCLVFTYFLGTSRWVRETTAAYSMGAQWSQRSRSLRSRAMAVAVVSILLVVATIATGAGAHTRAWPLLLHQIVPAGTYLFMLYAYWVEYTAVEAHMALTDEVMVEVNRIRSERSRSVPPKAGSTDQASASSSPRAANG